MKSFSLKSVIKTTLWILLFSSLFLYSQNNSGVIQNVFSKIKAGMEKGKVILFSDYFTENTYINLENIAADYFSKEQAYYVLQNYLTQINPSDFQIIKTDIQNNNPFIIGRIVCSPNGENVELRFFSSLKSENGNWKISQIIINR